MELLQNLIPLIEILLITVMINYLLSFFWNTRAMDLALGFLIFLLVFAASSWIGLPVLEKILYSIINVVAIAILVIFQPELRIALSKLNFKGKKFREVTEYDKFLDSLATSTYRLADRKIGALIILANTDNLDEYANRGIQIGADFSSELIESIFAISTPLHDGGVIVKEKRIMAASVILPLADDISQLTKSMGTRHRAGLGISQVTDALTVIISEETGKVSITRDGIITRGVQIDRFKGIIRSVFTSPTPPLKKSNSILRWLRK